MILRLFACVLILLSFAACKSLETPYKKTDAEAKKPLKDVPSDPTFQAFVGRLRIAAGKHDKTMLASMMTNDFGYRWDNPPPGETAFDFWDQRNLWGSLLEILRGKFAPNDMYLMAPPQAASDPNYAGYRVGIRNVGGSWKFAYFVPAEPKQ